MNNLGFNTTYEEGEKGQFELFRKVENYEGTYMKEGPGIPKFFTLADVERKLGGLGEY